MSSRDVNVKVPVYVPKPPKEKDPWDDVVIDLEKIKNGNKSSNT